MWSILRSPNTNLSVTIARIISDNGKNAFGKKQKGDGFVRLYLGMSNLMLEKHERGINKTLSRLRSEVVDADVCQGFTTDKFKAAICNCNCNNCNLLPLTILKSKKSLTT